MILKRFLAAAIFGTVLLGNVAFAEGEDAGSKVFIKDLKQGQLKLTLLNVDVFNRMVRDSRKDVLIFDGYVDFPQNLEPAILAQKYPMACSILPSTKKLLDPEHGDKPLSVEGVIEGIDPFSMRELRIRFSTNHIMSCVRDKRAGSVSDVDLQNTLKGLFRVEIVN